MHSVSEHRFTFPIVRPFYGHKTEAPIRSALPVSQPRLVEQSLLRRPSPRSRDRREFDRRQ
jgi:hypothetical protein